MPSHPDGHKHEKSKMNARECTYLKLHLQILNLFLISAQLSHHVLNLLLLLLLQLLLLLLLLQL